MPPDLWTSVFAGVALGALNAAAAYALYRVGRQRAPKAFLSIVFGGMVARLLVVTAAIGLVLLLLPVDRLAFTGGFLVAFSLGTAAEVAILQRHAAHSQP
ncbi:MAG: hypothetical protein R3181_13040 [Rubricoccaceae bacterium]|nr:hypothetical protein [Rubricoccaceae bacterium]